MGITLGKTQLKWGKLTAKLFKICKHSRKSGYFSGGSRKIDGSLRSFPHTLVMTFCQWGKLPVCKELRLQAKSEKQPGMPDRIKGKKCSDRKAVRIRWLIHWNLNPETHPERKSGLRDSENSRDLQED